MKVCVLGASFNTGNLGVSVLAAGALKCVLNTFPDAEVIQLDYGYRPYTFAFSSGGAETTVQFVNARFSKKFYLRNNIALLLLLAFVGRLIPIRKARSWLLSRNSVMKQIIDCKLAVSLAGGDSFSDIYGFARLVYVALPQILCLLAGVRLIQLPQTIGPFHSTWAKLVARYILGRSERVYTRDYNSGKTAERLMPPQVARQKVRFCYDLGFDVEASAPASEVVTGLDGATPAVSPIVGLNISGLLMKGGYTGDNMFALRVSYSRLMTRLIRFFIEARSARIVLFPHVYGIGSEDESDAAACRRLYDEFRDQYGCRIGLVQDNSLDYRHMKHLIGKCDFFVGARMHACIGALSQSVPAVSIAYSDKFAGVMETIGIADLVVDCRTSSEDEILRRVDDAFVRRTSIRSSLQAEMPIVKETIRGLLRNVETR